MPQRWAENKPLGSWAGWQRKNYQKEILSTDRIKRLEDVGFVWDSLESQWKEMFTMLKEYKDKHGDCYVPRQWAENKQLGGWVLTQRTSYSDGILSKDRIKCIERIGFGWDCLDKMGGEMCVD